jgi:hypothetical protein
MIISKYQKPIAMHLPQNQYQFVSSITRHANNAQQPACTSAMGCIALIIITALPAHEPAHRTTLARVAPQHDGKIKLLGARKTKMCLCVCVWTAHRCGEVHEIFDQPLLCVETTAAEFFSSRRFRKNAKKRKRVERAANGRAPRKKPSDSLD